MLCWAGFPMASGMGAGRGIPDCWGLGWQAQHSQGALLTWPGANCHKWFLTQDQTIGYFIYFIGASFKGSKFCL